MSYVYTVVFVSYMKNVTKIQKKNSFIVSYVVPSVPTVFYKRAYTGVSSNYDFNTLNSIWVVIGFTDLF